MLDLTVSIVSYNTRGLLRRCLKSIYRHTRGIKFEVIVIDNASADNSAAMVKRDFPQVKLIRNRINRFYAGANNQSLKIATGKYFLILNSDMYLKTNALKAMAGWLSSHPGVAAIEPLQMYENGRVAPTGSRHNTVVTDFMELTWLGRKLASQNMIRRFRMASKNRRRTWPAAVICDAALMIPSDLMRHLGGYDANLKLYYTENDLCQRIQAAGFLTYHVGNISMWHRVSASTNQVSWTTISQIYARDAYHYHRKWGNVLTATCLFLLLKLNNWMITMRSFIPA